MAKILPPNPQIWRGPLLRFIGKFYGVKAESVLPSIIIIMRNSVKKSDFSIGANAI